MSTTPATPQTPTAALPRPPWGAKSTRWSSSKKPNGSSQNVRKKPSRYEFVWVLSWHQLIEPHSFVKMSKIILKINPNHDFRISTGFLRSDKSRQPDRVHVCSLLAQREVHAPPFSWERSGLGPDEQLLHGARIKVGLKHLVYTDL